MASPAYITDGSQQYGTGSDVTLTNPDASTFVCTLNNYTISRPNTKAIQHNASGAPNKQRWTFEPATFEGEAQLASSSTVLPIEGATFSITTDATHGAELFVLLEPKAVRTNGGGDIRTVPLTAEKVINGSVTVT